MNILKHSHVLNWSQLIKRIGRLRRRQMALRKRERIERTTGRRKNRKIRRSIAEKSEERNRRSKEERLESAGEESDNLPKI